jgi:ABC-2 type transport system permease protein
MSSIASVARSRAAATRRGELRSGLTYWLQSLAAMMRFDFGRMRQWLGMMIVIQTMMGAGMVIMYGFFYPHVTAARALYIATGSPTLALIPLGLVMLPGDINQQRMEGTFEYVWSLPAPRSAQAISTFLLYTLLALPGTALALLVATWRYGAQLSISPVLIPAALLCSLVAITVGYGLALAIRNPLVMNLISNALVFVVLLFSPIVFPASQLPAWLYDIHRVLPFYNMAVVMRAGLTSGIETQVGTSFIVLAAWTIAGCAMTAWVIGRRH